MPNTVIDTLEVKITANAMTAAKALDGLANSLKNVRAVLNNTNKAGASIGDKLAKNIHDLNNAMTRINNDGIKKLQFLSNALNSYANAVQKVKAAGALGGNVTKDIKRLTNATTVKTDLADQKGGSEDADKKVTGIKRLGEAFNDFKKKVDLGNSALGRLFSAIKRIAIYRAIRSALKAISEAFTEGLKNAYAYSQQSDSFKELADTLDHIKTITYQMTNQLGAFWGEIKQLVAPVVEWLVEKVRQLSERLTELFAALNGKSTYLRAKQVAQTWGEATDNVKSFKQQLFGLDELNNLTTQKNSGKEDVDPKDLYEEVNISSKIKDIAEDYNSLKKKLEGIFNDYRSTLLVGVGLLAIGAIFTFFTTKKILGLGLMLASGLLIGKTVIENKDQLYNDVQGAMEKYRWLFAAGAIGLTAIGAALLFTGHWKLGLGCVLGGVAIGATDILMNWELMYSDIERAMQEYRWLFALGAIGLTALGAGLLFTGHYPLGIACILGGVALGVTDVKMNWEQMYTDIESAFESYSGLFAITGTAMSVIGLLLLSTGHIGLGLGILVAGSYLNYENIKVNWNSIFDSAQEQWNKIRSWWNSNVKGNINKAANWIEETFHIDLNGDGKYGGLQTDFSEKSGLKGGAPYANSSAYLSAQGVTTSSVPKMLDYDPIKATLDAGVPTFGEKTKTLWDNTYGYENVKKVVNDTVEDAKVTLDLLADTIERGPIGQVKRWVEEKVPTLFKADGGFVGQGSLFYAGEAGPEFVGSMGGNTAVANTSQMTEAIYKAAYMGMSQALKENGGNGLSGFVPASTDDLFIAMRKKASVYNKTTGNSAFA